MSFSLAGSSFVTQCVGSHNTTICRSESGMGLAIHGIHQRIEYVT